MNKLYSQQYHALLPYLTKYPHLSGCLVQVHNDLVHAQRWKETEILVLQACGRIALKGKHPETNLLQNIVPCYINESISLDWLSSVFKELDGTTEIHLAIVSDDSSVVYYRVSNGIVKPPS